MEQERIVIDFGGSKKMAVLTVQPFDGDIDTESLLKIDYSNILGEILTFPVVFNRIANLKAEMTEIVAQRKLSLDILEAQLYEEHQNTLNASRSGTREVASTTIQMAVVRDKKFEVKKKELIRLQRDFEYLDALYWSAQSKDKKLNVLSEKITPSEFEKELVEGAINGVMIKMSKKVIA